MSPATTTGWNRFRTTTLHSLFCTGGPAWRQSFNDRAFSCAHADTSYTTRSFVVSAFLLTTARWGRKNSLPVTSAGARSTTPSSSCSLITASYSSSRSVFLSFRTRVFNLRKLPSLLFGKGGQFPFQGSPVSYHPSGERTNCILISGCRVRQS